MSPVTWLTYVLPHRVLSSAARRLAYSQHQGLKQWLINTVVKKFGVDLEEAAEADANRYPSFNAFFTRELKTGVRTPPASADVLSMPADGRVSQCGTIQEGRIFQAKGQSFTTAELLGDESLGSLFHDGEFATIYLSPRDYHRVHMPCEGTLVETLHVPGRLFSVGPDAVRNVPRLFARNERLVCHFETAFGPMMMVMVGALLVSGVETVWSGIEIPTYGDRIQRKDWRGKDITLARFAEMARFNYGSTVIVLLPSNTGAWVPGLGAESPVRLGEPMFNLSR